MRTSGFLATVSERTEIVKGLLTEHTGQRVFCFRDPDGYVIGVNDNAAFRNSDLGSKYAES
ncbi:VOC family protein [Streptomyces sp. NPDC008001]|uniref:VOC family protein n=1 Tax=Streptomyces sp. NPDC008001 TaxID=3364804 RepID=UPI0036E46326